MRSVLRYGGLTAFFCFEATISCTKHMNLYKSGS
nr:MAG TPA: hypothetical protein [Caudoviricetes sp.]